MCTHVQAPRALHCGCHTTYALAVPVPTPAPFRVLTCARWPHAALRARASVRAAAARRVRASLACIVKSTCPRSVTRKEQTGRRGVHAQLSLTRGCDTHKRMSTHTERENTILRPGVTQAILSYPHDSRHIGYEQMPLRWSR
eukprot:6172589-Pleurochrysis_carterae.AAC.1